jgi:hypothetical protein
MTRFQIVMGGASVTSQQSVKNIDLLHWSRPPPKSEPSWGIEMFWHSQEIAPGKSLAHRAKPINA